MPGSIGPMEIVILLVVVLLVFGPKRLPEMGRSVGKGLREFKDSISGVTSSEAAAAEPAQLTAASAAAPAPAPGAAPAARSDRDDLA